MDQVQKTAIKETTKTVAGLTACGIAIPTVIYLVPFDALIFMACVAMLGMGVKMIYDIELGRAKAKQEEIDAEINRLHK